MNNPESIRHRTATKHGSEVARFDSTRDDRTRRSDKSHNQKLHVSVWARFIAIVIFFTIFSLVISIFSRIGGPKAIRAVDESNQLFVTVVMPRSVPVIP